jgi:iron complex outermembrane receptor protein
MKTISNRCRNVLALRICVFLFAIGSATPNAQSSENSATLSGAVVDVTGKAIANAAISVRNESGGAIHQARSDAEGQFSINGLAEGLYSIEASAPSFSSSRRTGVRLATGATEKVAMSLDVSELVQTITVEGSVSLAAEKAPSQNTLEARSAKSEISPEYIQNFASPVADYTELLNNSPGTFSVNPNGVGLATARRFSAASRTVSTRCRPTASRSTTPTIPLTTPGRSFPASLLRA